MGRKRKGRDISGWLVVDKPAGPTSTAVVNKVRWALGAAKAGHAGTLDPAATGVLAIALGEADAAIARGVGAAGQANPARPARLTGGADPRREGVAIGQ